MPTVGSGGIPAIRMTAIQMTAMTMTSRVTSEGEPLEVRAEFRLEVGALERDLH